jgi:hypothetical protein
MCRIGSAGGLFSVVVGEFGFNSLLLVAFFVK